jgi:hypothetical protein
MAKGVLIIGASGTGKSTSVSHLNPQETFIINVQNKDLPFKGAYKNYKYVDIEVGPPTEGNLAITNNPVVIKKLCEYIDTNRPDIKNIVIDDWQYVAATEFMQKADQKGFDKFTSIGKNIWLIADLPNVLKRRDLDLFYLTHSESAYDEITGTQKMKAKTVGKLVDNVLTLEGMFTVVLYTDVVKTKEKGIEYTFITQNDGTSTAKSPMGMFEDLKIPNNLQLVKEKMYEYYN